MKGIRGRVRRLTTHLHGRDADRGVTSIEYAGLVIIVAAIIIAIRALGLDATISECDQHLGQRCRRRRLTDDSGQTLLMYGVVITGVLFLAFAFFAVAQAAAVRNGGQSAADAAALAAAQDDREQYFDAFLDAVHDDDSWQDWLDLSQTVSPDGCAAAADFAGRNDSDVRGCDPDPAPRRPRLHRAHPDSVRHRKHLHPRRRPQEGRGRGDSRRPSAMRGEQETRTASTSPAATRETSASTRTPTTRT